MGVLAKHLTELGSDREGSRILTGGKASSHDGESMRADEDLWRGSGWLWFTLGITKIRCKWCVDSNT